MYTIVKVQNILLGVGIPTIYRCKRNRICLLSTQSMEAKVQAKHQRASICQVTNGIKIRILVEVVPLWEGRGHPKASLTLRMWNPDTWYCPQPDILRISGCMGHWKHSLIDYVKCIKLSALIWRLSSRMPLIRAAIINLFRPYWNVYFLRVQIF